MRRYLGVLAGMAALCVMSWAQAPAQGETPDQTSVLTLAQAQAPAPTPAPTFGQHSDEILAGCGYSADEITALRERGVVL